jgi:hypothetical protein
VSSEAQKFDNLVAALPRDSVRLVLDTLENPSPTTPDTQLKAKLLASHELTHFQRIGKLHQMGDLSDKKPSELLASMLRVMPQRLRGQQVLLIPVFTAASGQAACAPRRQ